MASQDSYPETQNASTGKEAISRDEKINKTGAIMGMEEGSTTTIDADDQLLATLGYRSELKREFSYFTVFGQSFGAMGIAPAIAESMIFSLGSAGAVGMVWTYLVGCLLLIPMIPVALSLGELGSSMPTAGGLYYVSFTFQMPLDDTNIIHSGLHVSLHLGKEHLCAGLR
jgi:amino acid permease